MADKTIPAFKILRGNVGVNVATPTEKLHVDGAGYFEGGGVRDGGWHRGLEITTQNSSYASLYFGGQSTTKYSGIIWTSTTSGNTVSARGAQIYTLNTSATNSDIKFDTNNAVGSSSPTTKMIIKGGGNVGVGTTNPGGKLESYITGGGEIGLRLNSNFSGGNTVDFIPAIVGVSNAGFSINLAGTNRLVINSSGSVGIGTNAPGDVLHVDGNTIIGDTDRQTTILTIKAQNTAGAPAATTQIRMKGYEGRGIGTFYEDSSYSGQEWFCGMNYSAAFGYWNVGYDASGGQAEYNANTLFRVKYDGSIDMLNYGSGTFTGTAAYKLAVDSSGNIIETAVGSGQVDGSGTASNVALWSDTDTLGNSIITQSGTAYAQVNGGVRITGNHTDTGSQLNIWCDNSGHARAAAYDYFFYTGGNSSRSNVALFLKTDGNVGINTTSPAYKLDVYGGDARIGTNLRLGNGTAAGNANDPAITVSGYTNAGMYFESSGVGLGAGTGKYLFLNSSGSVGIGTNAPANSARLDVRGRISVREDSELQFGTHADYAFMEAWDTTADRSPKKPIAINPWGGSVGIGTVSPDSKLEIAGGSYNSSLKIKGSGGDTGIQFEDSGGTTDGYIYAEGGSIGFLDSGASWAIQCKNDDFIRFSTSGNTEHMRIDSDGEVGIGTNNPTQQLMVWEGSSSVSLGEYSNGAVIWLDGVNGDLTGGDYFNIWADGNLALRFGYGTGQKVSMLSSGSVGIGTTNPTNNLVVYASGHQVNFVTETDDHSGMRVKGAAAKDKYILFNDQCKMGYQHSTATLHFCRSGAFGDNHLVINSNGCVGIGTATPANALHIHTDSASDKTIFLDNTGSGQSGLTLRTDRNSDGNAANFIYFDAADDGGNNTRYATIESFIVDNTNGTEDGALRFSVMAGGNDVESMTISARSGHSDIGWVGIGTNAPTFPLQVDGPNLVNGSAKRIVCFRDTTSAAAGTGAGIALGGYTNGTASAINDFGVIQGIKENGSAGDYASALTFHTRANGANTAEQMRITSTGSVGIGCTPVRELDVDGRVRADTYGFRSDTALRWYYFDDYSGSNFIGRGGNAYTALYDSGALSMVWKGAFVGIGTTATMSSSSELFGVYSATTGHASFKNSSDSFGTVYIRNVSTTASTWQPYLILADSSGNRAGLGVKYSTAGLKVHGQGGIEFWTGSSYGGGSKKFEIDSGGAAIFSQSPTYKIKLTYSNGHTSAIVDTVGGNLEFRVQNTEVVRCSTGTWDFKKEARFPNNTGVYFIHADGSATAGIKLDTSDHLDFRTGGANSRMVLDDNGNLGIGAGASPTSRLHVTGDQGNGTFLAYIYNSGTQSEDNGLNVQVASSGTSCYGFRVNTGGNSNAFVVTGSSNVGIGYSPSNITEKFCVNGKTKLQSAGDGNNVLECVDSSGDAMFNIRQSGNDCLVRGYKDGGSQKWQIHSDGVSYFNGGDVQIGTATYTGGKLMVSNSDNTVFDASAASHQRDEGSTLMVNNESTTSGSFSQLLLRNRSSNVGGCRIVSITTGNDNSELAIVTGDTGESMRIKGNGNVGIGSSNPAYPLQVYYAGGAGIGLQVKGTANRSKLVVSDNDTSAYVIAEDSHASFGRNDSLTANNLNINAAGCVGIGIASPTALLHAVASGTEICLGLKGGNNLWDNLLINGLNSSGTGVFNVRNDGSTFGTKYGFYKSGSEIGGYFELTNQAGDSSSNDVTITAAHSTNSVVLRGAQSVQMWTYFGGAYVRRVMVQQNGNVGIGVTAPGYKLQVNGDFAASSKSFVIDHPTKEDKQLIHGSLEGPEYGVYHRGTIQSNTITLPDYWSGLVREDSITVQLTPRGEFQHLYVVSYSLTEVIIGAADSETINCFYTIYGERADIDRLEVEKEV